MSGEYGLSTSTRIQIAQDARRQRGRFRRRLQTSGVVAGVAAVIAFVTTLAQPGVL
jgi:hypothetical protein